MRAIGLLVHAMATALAAFGGYCAATGDYRSATVAVMFALLFHATVYGGLCGES